MAHKIQLEKNLPRKYANLLQTENCIGDYMVNAKNCIFTSHAHDAEDCKYAEDVWRSAKNMMDISTSGRNASWMYEILNSGIDVSNELFCVQAWTSQNLLYCTSCFNSQNCFGSTGLKKSHHCILNKSYSTAEYETLCGKIVDHMRSTGEWGEFFPHELSPFGYNETVANEYFPMTEDEVRAKGWNWHTEDTKPFEGIVYIPLPIREYDERVVGFETAQKNIDVVLAGTIVCEFTKKPFKIIKQELLFYIENSIPIPTKHPDQRHKERMDLRNPRTLYERACSECGKDIMTTYAPERPEKVVCEDCYRKIVY